MEETPKETATKSHSPNDVGDRAVATRKADLDKLAANCLRKLRRKQKLADASGASVALRAFAEKLFLLLENEVSRTCSEETVHASALQQIALAVKREVLSVWRQFSPVPLPNDWLALLDTRLVNRQEQAHQAFVMTQSADTNGRGRLEGPLANSKSAPRSTTDQPPSGDRTKQIFGSVSDQERAFIEEKLAETTEALSQLKEEVGPGVSSAKYAKLLFRLGNGLFWHLQGRTARLRLSDDIYTAVLEEVALSAEAEVLEVWRRVSGTELPPAFRQKLTQNLADARSNAQWHWENILAPGGVPLEIKPGETFVAEVDFDEPSNSKLRIEPTKAKLLVAELNQLLNGPAEVMGPGEEPGRKGQTLPETDNQSGVTKEDSESPATSSLTGTPSSRRGKRGPAPDFKRHRTIAAVARRYGDGWRNSVKMIASEFDSIGLQVPCCWRDDGIDTFAQQAEANPKKVIDAVRHSLRADSPTLLDHTENSPRPSKTLP